jgi:hypothetical protein
MQGDISVETLCFSPATLSSCGLDGLFDLIIRQRQAVVQQGFRA